MKALLFYIMYLTLDSKEDSMLAKLGGLNHRWNWILRAFVGVVFAILANITFKGVLATICLEFAVAVLYFDPVANYFLGFRGKELITHVGGGTWDNLSKTLSNYFGSKPWVYLYSMKFLVVLVTIYFYFLFK